MKHAIDFAELTHQIAQRFKSGYDEDPGRHIRMVGVIFAPPNSPISKAEILPQVNDWHYRSGKHIDFYFAGYTPSSGGAPGYEKVPIPGSRSFEYSSERFVAFRNEFESRSTWKPVGSAELLLLNARFDPLAGEARLDFTSVVCCQLDLMKSDHAIQSIERFFESVFRFADTADDTNPTRAFSDKQGIEIAGSALKRALLSLLPKSIASDYKRAEHFAVRDVSRV